MYFGKTHFRFVFIGAGSSVFTMRLVGDLLTEPCIESGEIVLVDVDEERLTEVSAGVQKLIAHTGRLFTLEVHINYERALRDADFVFFTYASGGYSAWKSDIEISTKFGVNQSVGDTIGPSAVIRILRSIPVALEIAHIMERLCPGAYIINYTNPEAAQCLAIQKYSGIACFGLCHGTPDTAGKLAAEVFHVSPERLMYQAGGVNHLTWFTDLRINGADVYPVLCRRLAETGYEKEEPVSSELYRIFGLYPAPGDRHVEEFFSTFLREGVIQERNLKWKNNDFVIIDQWRREDQKKLQSILKHGSGFSEFLSGSGETAAHFIRSLATGEVTTEMVNVLNEGYITNISPNQVVEVPAFVDQFGIHPVTIGSLPEGIAAKCEIIGREYQLLVEAAIEKDMKKVLQAVYLDPLCAMCDAPEILIKTLIQKNLHLLPKEWSEMQL